MISSIRQYLPPHPAQAITLVVILVALVFILVIQWRKTWRG